VAIRARNPCLLMRRLFRGRYDGFIPRILQSEPGKLAGGDRRGQAKAERGPANAPKTEWTTWRTWRSVETSVEKISRRRPLFSTFSDAFAVSVFFLSSPD
jgi:hypothetical protein